MNKLVTLKQNILPKSFCSQLRVFSSNSFLLFNGTFKSFDEDKKPLMKNAPEWSEANATESEADIKAEKEPEVSPENLKDQTAEWVRENKDKEGNLPPH